MDKLHREPPPGIMPEYIWKEKRANELFLAIYRYMNEKLPFPIEWAEEYNRLAEEHPRRGEGGQP